MSALKLVPPAPEQEAAELRTELEDLERALSRFADALAESEVAREVAQDEAESASLALHEAETAVGEYRVLYARAQTLRDDLELRLRTAEEALAITEAELAAREVELDITRRERERAKTTAQIRARLVGDIVEARLWQRRAAVARATRVERLLG